MKKLMFIAAVAAVSVAQAECYEPKEDLEYGIYPVYKFKATLKTTKGLTYYGGGTNPSCGEGDADGCLKVRTKDTMSLSGWLYAVDPDCTCNGWVNNAVVWDTKRKTQLTDAKFTFDLANTNPNVIGRKQNEAEALWELEGTFQYDTVRAQTIELTGAGLGSFKRSNATYSLSGNCAGKMSASYDLKATVPAGASEDLIDCICKESAVWECDDLEGIPQASDTVAYGTWTMKYNASATKKYNKVANANAYKTLVVPAYVKFAE